jgi:glycosyltransferase involved in cell wall biosynthesis
MTRVTVGIPFYNNEAVLADTIRSVFAQTYHDWELILLDDGSTDGSFALAQAVQGAQVRAISDGVNRGVSYCRNQIASLARGEFVAYVDADDLMHPERLERQVIYLDAHPELEVMGTAIITINRANTPLGIRTRQPINLEPRVVLRYGLLMQSTVMGRTRWFRANPYDLGFRRSQDHELWCRTYGQPVFGKLLEPLLFYRESHRKPEAYLRLYLLNLRFDRKICQMYGPQMVGWPRTAWLLLQYYAKALVYRGATRLGLQDRVVRQRSQPLTAEEYEAAVNAVDLILHTPIPGLDPVDNVMSDATIALSGERPV